MVGELNLEYNIIGVTLKIICLDKSMKGIINIRAETGGRFSKKFSRQ